MLNLQDTGDILLEKDLRESEDRFDLLIHVLGEGVGIVDSDEVFILANESAEEIFQVGKGELIGRCVKDFLTEEGIRQVINETSKRKEGIKSSYELEIITDKKEKRIIIITATPYLSRQNNFQGSLGVFRDITERKNMERQLVALNADKDRFMQILAHDLRGPFNGMISYSDMLLKSFRKLDAEKIEKQLTVINKAAKNTYDLLNDILMWSKSHSGKLPFDPEILNLHEISGSVLGEKTSQADLKNISLNNLVPEGLVVAADKNMLNTVLRNLVSNAIKFTHRDGSVNIKADREENSVRLTVSDNGVGISSEDIGRLWNFAKPYTTEGTEKESGTGLGLVLCKEFVEKHGGKIKAESVLGKGTDFIFTLPLFVN